jgi:signal transduction histidine kinase
METASTIANAKPRLLLGVLVMTGVTLLQLATEFLGAHDPLRLLSKSLALLFGLPLLILWAFAVLRWSARFQSGLVAPLLFAAAGAGLFFAVFLKATRAVALSIMPPQPDNQAFSSGDALRMGFMLGLTWFALWALAFVLPQFAENVRLRKLEAEKLRAQAELAQLRSHLEPHFLLNTLNTIAGLVTEDPRQARRLLGNLGDLLRDSITSEGEMETLDAQIGWLRRYAQILVTRHTGQLEFHWEIGDGTPCALLPRLLLQPLVENAVKHGALMRVGGGEITVRTQLDGPRLVCTVEDNGPGLPAATRPGAFGLASVRRRLALRYADAGTLRLESAAGKTRSIVELPADLGSPS